MLIVLLIGGHHTRGCQGAIGANYSRIAHSNHGRQQLVKSCHQAENRKTFERAASFCIRAWRKVPQAS